VPVDAATQHLAVAASGVAQAPLAAAAVPSVCASPLYGVVHLQPTPAEPPYVAVGDTVRAGQTLCVIEAMKVFNEVQAERTGVVQAVLVQTGDEVEAGQALFRVA
jgi:acetyl-CoA carboxylase biotin carboxyl carrier protein